MPRQDYDRFAISRAIDQVQDPALRAFLEATADVVTGISGNAQLSAIEATDRVRSELATLLLAVRSVEVASTNTLAAVTRQEAAGIELRADFHSLFEVVSGLGLDINDLKQAVAEHEREIVSFRQSRDASIDWRNRRDIDLDLINEELLAARAREEAIMASLARIEEEQQRRAHADDLSNGDAAK